MLHILVSNFANERPAGGLARGAGSSLTVFVINELHMEINKKATVYAIHEPAATRVPIPLNFSVSHFLGAHRQKLNQN